MLRYKRAACLVPQVHGPTAINVHQLLDQLREQGELFLIGAEVRGDTG